MTTFKIYPGFRCDEQFFVWIAKKTITNRVAAVLDAGGQWNVTQTLQRGRWISPDMPDSGCMVVWYAPESNMHPQELQRQLRQAVEAAIKTVETTH